MRAEGEEKSNEVGEVKYCQSYAIAKYAARLVGLMPGGLEDQLLCDMVIIVFHVTSWIGGAEGGVDRLDRILNIWWLKTNYVVRNAKRELVVESMNT